ncbi:hypothetical protein NMT40_003665 [Vibrio cholerae]|uniref:DUF6602 domain-containing protein n=1 Tax=Vibrio cholerae TaxID=666 RepID=UPI00155F3994|nr:DUF6602 domain-containing protein [Vibrio cholerae]HDY8178595.1 hypothetical protein [Vibrio vulnificus]EJL6539162.1 hypothetical protein [Vibrio cholerae]EJL6984049.1 hypothetical protein [Vibrio cholerae]EKG0006019.1 hypothetical protein [Vibrio cholerae]NOE64006.1 hypothetical protein [Vibrio cholerae]
MKLIQRHLKNIEKTLSSYYELTSISGHSGNMGVSRELIVKHFLSQNLSSSLDFTGGEVFDCNNQKSGQLDIIIHQSSAMKLNIGEGLDLIPVDCAKAIIECKSSLQSGSMKSRGSSSLKVALDACVKVKSLKRINPVGMDEQYLKNRNMPKEALDLLYNISGLKVSLEETPYFIVAFKGPREHTLRDKLFEYMNVNGIPLEKMPNMITILGSQGYSLVKNDGFFMKKVTEPKRVHWSRLVEAESSLVALYMYLMKISEVNELSENFFPMKEYLN